MKQVYWYWIALLVLLVGACTPTPTAPTVARIELSPGAILFTKAGESQTLTAKAFDASGKEIKAEVSWSSKNPSVVGVDNSGKVTAIGSVGSAQISAQVGSVKGTIMALLAQPVAGAVLVNDQNIVSDIQPVNASAEFGVGFQYRITLQNVAPPSPGAILLSSGEKPVAGKVVAVEGNNVTLEVVPIDEVFANLDINQSLNLAEAPFSTPQAIAQNFESRKLPDGRVQLSLKPGHTLSSPGFRPGQVRPQANIGPFDCEFESIPIQIDLLKADVTYTPNLSFDVVWNNTHKKMVVKGQPEVVFNLNPVVAVAVEGKVVCKLTVREIQIPLPGPLGLFLGAVIPIGAGFEIGGKFPVARAGVEVKGKVGMDFQAGFDCNPSCAPVTSLSKILDGNVTPVPPQSFQGLKVEASAYGFLFADFEGGARFSSTLRLEAIESLAGVKLEAKLASEDTQAGDTAYASDYKLAYEASIGVGKDMQKFFKLIKLTLAKLEFKVTQDLASSPTATIKADKDSFKTGDTVNFKVSLDPSKLNFPLVGYNLNSVRIYRKTPTSLVLANEVNAGAGQSELQIPWVATLDGNVADNFIAFVETKLLPAMRLELGTAKADSGCTAVVGVKYCVTDLGTLGGGSSIAHGINENGQVVGDSFNPSNSNSQQRAFLWQNGQMTDLGEPLTFARGINDKGQVVGVSQSRAFIWQNGQMTKLGTLGGTSSVALGINNAGQVVGQSFTSSEQGGQGLGFLWQNGQMTKLATLGGTPSTAYGINDNEQVVGSSSTSSGASPAVLWQNGQITILGTLGGTNSFAHGINDNGQVVGSSRNSSNQDRAFLWRSGQMTDLGTLGGTSSTAHGINNAGQVVGDSLTSNNQPRAFLWQNGQMTNLNTLIDPSLGWTLRTAKAINDKGQIVGEGIRNNQFRAILLTPVP